MERGFESFPGLDPERGEDDQELSPELEPSSEKLLEMFEDGSRFNDENAKEIDYNNRLDQADAYRKKSNELTEQISNATTQLASVPLTYDQQVLLTEIEALMARRKASKNRQEQSELDVQIEAKTKELARLPVTDEQGSLLDDILRLMDEREAIEIKLHSVFNES